MTEVRRIVANIAADDPARAKAFYGGILGLRKAMDHGWIVTWAGTGEAPAQVSVATEGGSGTPVPHLSIEVDRLQPVVDRLAVVGIGPVAEPWGVRRIFVRDPFGRLVNILEHRAGL